MLLPERTLGIKRTDGSDVMRGPAALPRVWSVGGGGAVGVEYEPPAAAVDAHVVVELAQQHAVADGGLAAVGLVLQVVHVAPGGWPSAAGPGAAAVPEEDGAADAGRDGVGVADVQ